MNTPLQWMRAFVPPAMRPKLKNVAYTIRGKRHAGNQRACPVCGGHFARFLPNPRDGRQDARCPRCDTLERHRLLTLYLQRHTGWYTKPLKVLDFAPMYPMLKAFKALPNLDYTSADLMLGWVDVNLDITDIPYETGTFDAIICYHVIEHVPDDRTALAELFRILKPGGWAIIQVPVDFNRDATLEDPSIQTAAGREKVYGHHDHKRLYGRDFELRLAEAGFDVEVVPFLNEFSEAEKKRYGLRDSRGFVDDVYIFVSRKQGRVR